MADFVFPEIYEPEDGAPKADPRIVHLSFVPEGRETPALEWTGHADTLCIPSAKDPKADKPIHTLVTARAGTAETLMTFNDGAEASIKVAVITAKASEIGYSGDVSGVIVNGVPTRGRLTIQTALAVATS